MKRVLLSTDFSDNANHAIEYALALFASQAVDYYLLNSYCLRHNIPETLISLEDILHEQSQKRLDSTMAQIRAAYKDLHIESMSIYGDASKTIKKVANDRQVDLVVLGSRGSALNDAIYGSTSSQLIRGMNQPMLIVPGNYDKVVPKKILLATDLVQIDDLSVLDTMLDIARRFKAEVIVLNVTAQKEITKVQQAIERLDFNNHFEGIDSRFEVVNNKDIVAGINDYAHGNQVDILVLFPKHYPRFESMFHRSVTKTLVRHTDIPVMVV